MSKGSEAFAALVAALDLPAEDTRLPDEVKVNDTRLNQFDASGRFLAVRKGDTVRNETELGGAEGPVYELALEAQIIFAVEGEASPEREAALQSAEDAFFEALFSDRTLGGKVDYLDTDGAIERALVQEDRNAKPVAYLSFTLFLFFTSRTPFG